MFFSNKANFLPEWEAEIPIYTNLSITFQNTVNIATIYGMNLKLAWVQIVNNFRSEGSESWESGYEKPTVDHINS